MRLSSIKARVHPRPKTSPQAIQACTTYKKELEYALDLLFRVTEELSEYAKDCRKVLFKVNTCTECERYERCPTVKLLEETNR